VFIHDNVSKYFPDVKVDVVFNKIISNEVLSGKELYVESKYEI
jgi:hypothetical protein